MSSYQKLKKKNEELQKEVAELCLRPNSIKSESIRAAYWMRLQQEMTVFYGDRAFYERETGGIYVRPPYLGRKLATYEKP